MVVARRAQTGMRNGRLWLAREHQAEVTNPVRGLLRSLFPAVPASEAFERAEVDPFAGIGVVGRPAPPGERHGRIDRAALPALFAHVFVAVATNAFHFTPR